MSVLKKGEAWLRHTGNRQKARELRRLGIQPMTEAVFTPQCRFVEDGKQCVLPMNHDMSMNATPHKFE